MGTLKYDGIAVGFEDRLLAHIEMIVVQKLRRQETFLLTWEITEELGGGRTSIWLHPAIQLTFHFTTSDKPNIDRAWLEKLMVSANSPMGMFVTDVDGDSAYPSDVARGV
jgi:hypothetical protein